MKKYSRLFQNLSFVESCYRFKEKNGFSPAFPRASKTAPNRKVRNLKFCDRRFALLRKALFHFSALFFCSSALTLSCVDNQAVSVERETLFTLRIGHMEDQIALSL